MVDEIINNDIIEGGSPNGEPSNLSINDEMINKLNEIIKEQMSAFKTEFESIKDENKNLKFDVKKREINELLLNDPNLDTGFFDFVYSDDIEETKQKISILSGMIKDRVKSIADKEVNDRLNGGYKPPKNDGIKLSFNKPDYML